MDLRSPQPGHRGDGEMAQLCGRREVGEIPHRPCQRDCDRKDSKGWAAFNNGTSAKQIRSTNWIPRAPIVTSSMQGIGQACYGPTVVV